MVEAHRPPDDYAGRPPDAIEATMQANHLMQHLRTRDDLLRARALLDGALGADPDSATALTAWGATHIVEVLRR